MTTCIPHVKDMYFQHKVLTQVHSKPTFNLLKIINNELKANASSVPSTLGGGMFGHLSLLLGPVQYTTILPTLFISPDNPGPFVPPAAGTGPQIAAAKDVWQESHLTFELCQVTKKP